MYAPTAEQAVSVGQDTPERTLCVAPLTAGVGWIDQVVPFHCSMSAPAESHPTAMQALTAGHDTCSSTPFDGIGMGWIDQAAPFHSSASGM